ncbi:MAG: PTS sugar transporter subunit IIA [Lactobacillales bacterium]|jgi:PTS system galactitol-specific IIA component|nr:PTS sugar transporter subunit IIA [Lactobacillales bacterium]
MSKTNTFSLFSNETVYLSDKESVSEIFEEVSQDLVQKGLVHPSFFEHLILREEEYPTGIDLSVVHANLPNIAIPHTESDYVNVNRIVPVKLLHPVTFHNMILPDQTIEVSFLFMILNKNGAEQAGLLAQIMDFIQSVTPQELKHFFELTDVNKIYQFIEMNFKEEKEND